MYSCLNARAALVGCVGVLHAGAAWAAARPVAGDYSVTSYIVSASSGCLFPAGTYLSAVYTYPGPGKAGAIARTFVNGAGGNFIEVFKFPVTPAAGAANWSGNYVQTFLPGGTPVTGTFSIAIQYVDARSFVDTATYMTVVNGVTCTTIAQEGHVLEK